MGKKIAIVIAVLVIVAGGAFYAGIKYGQTKQTADRGNFNPAAMSGGYITGDKNGAGRANGNGGFTSGEIISKDEKSLTVKLPDGGSKIIFFTENTPIVKSAEGTNADLAIGEQVSVSGTANSDGSLNAKSIQIRPEVPQKTE